jgi:hypothetical protein
MHLALMGLGFEVRTLHLLGKYSTIWAKTPALFALVCFSDRVSLLALDHDSPTSASHVAGIIAVCSHASFFFGGTGVWTQGFVLAR